MESELKQVSGSVFALIGPQGATNFTVIKNRAGSAILIDADIRRIDEIEEALQLAGCSRLEYLIDTHEHFDHTSANFYFAQRGIPIIASVGCTGAMGGQGGPDFERMMRPVPELYERFPGLCLTLPDVQFTDRTKVTLPG